MAEAIIPIRRASLASRRLSPNFPDLVIVIKGYRSHLKFLTPKRANMVFFSRKGGKNREMRTTSHRLISRKCERHHVHLCFVASGSFSCQ
ncbi:hypothetical protein CA056_16940 [Salmonella enterica]|nr:hypothetical protein [Salmonella enterica]